MTPTEALELTFTDPDADEVTTIRDYFKRLLSTLFEEGEGFSGKRPFGNSGWEGNLELPLVEAGCIPGKIVYSRYDEETGRYCDITKEEFEDLGQEAVDDGDAVREVEGVKQHEYDAYVQTMIAAL